MQQRVLTDKAEEALSLNDFSTVRTHSIAPRVRRGCSLTALSHR